VATGGFVGDIAVAEGLLSREQVEEILAPRRLTGFPTG